MKVRIARGDITRLEVDAIVNAANERLLGGGGVDGAIHRAAGARLLDACRRIEELRPGVRCPTGEGRITPGFELPARFVIHVVGPVWRGGAYGEHELLASCYRRVFALCAEHRLRSVAIPAISCGVYGFPLAAAAQIAVAETKAALDAAAPLDEVVLIAFEQDVHAALISAGRDVGIS
jgi:O-acetyl-ADP-ribose deacetylase (regulator of RNase III)